MDKVVDHLLVSGVTPISRISRQLYASTGIGKTCKTNWKEAEAALQARQNPAPEKPSRPVNEQKEKLTSRSGKSSRP